MTFAARLLRSTLGLVSPGYRTVADWAVLYRRIVDSKPISDKTKANRLCSLRHIVDALGPRTISLVLPLEIAEMVQRIHAQHPALAKRVLIECKNLFNEAVIYGWLNRSPAFLLKAPAVQVQRHRLSLEHWRAIYAWSVAHQPPWVPRMLVLALVSGQRRSDLAEMRFADVWEGHLHVEQIKSGMRLALPLSLRLDTIGVSLGEAIEDCRGYAARGDCLLRKHNGRPLAVASLSARFEEARDAVIALPATGLPASLHECRSLAERLYRPQGVNTMVLLGHRDQETTDLYDNPRDLDDGRHGWTQLEVAG